MGDKCYNLAIMKKRECYFEKALTNFVQDFADGGAIRHLADKGLTVPQIAGRLDYPLPLERVGELVWRHYTETGRIRLEQPEQGERGIQRVRYVKEQGAYGRVSMRRVVEELDGPEGPYLECDFGRLLYRDREDFLKKTKALSKEDRDYVIYLPWPLRRVWHSEDERIRRILGCL